VWEFPIAINPEAIIAERKQVILESLATPPHKYDLTWRSARRKFSRQKNGDTGKWRAIEVRPAGSFR
jgi:hypothetical protein